MHQDKVYGTLLWILLVLMWACTVPKSLPNRETSLPQIDQIIRSYQNIHLEPHQNITISGKIRIGKKEAERSFHSKIHIHPGKKIWINASFLGFSVAKALISPHEIAAYEKIQKTYLKGDFSLANQYLNTDFIDYSQVEDLFLGRSLFNLDSENYRLSPNREDHLYTLTSKSDALFTKSAKPVRGYTHTIEIDSNLCIRKELIKKTDTSEELLVIYDNWQKIDDQLFPRKIYIFVDAKTRSSLSLEAMEIKTNEPIETSFSIPEGYKERNW